MGLTQARK